MFSNIIPLEKVFLTWWHIICRICMWFWDGEKFEPFGFYLISARNIDHVSKFRAGSIFEFWNSEMAQLLSSEISRWLKLWHVIDELKFNRRFQLETEWFEIWAISKSNAYAIMWQISLFVHQHISSTSHLPFKSLKIQIERPPKFISNLKFKSWTSFSQLISTSVKYFNNVIEILNGTWLIQH